MQISVPFFRQKTDYTCGPACLRMLFAMHGKTVGEDAIARDTSTRERTGTARTAMLRAARKHGFVCRMSSNATWKDIIANLEKGMPVLINYREPSEEEGHYALVVGTSGKNVLLHDPWNGQEFSLDAKELKRRWLGHRTKNIEQGWMMTIMAAD